MSNEKEHGFYYYPKDRNIRGSINNPTGDNPVVFTDRGRSAVPIVMEQDGVYPNIPERDRKLLSDLKDGDPVMTTYVPYCDYIRQSIDVNEFEHDYPLSLIRHVIERCRDSVTARTDSGCLDDGDDHQGMKRMLIENSLFEQYNNMMSMFANSERLGFGPLGSDTVCAAIELVRLAFNLGVRIQQADVVLSEVDSATQKRADAARAGNESKQKKKTQREALYRECFDELKCPRDARGNISKTTYSKIRKLASEKMEAAGMEYRDLDEKTIRGYLEGM